MADSDATSKPTTTAEVHQVAETKVDASNNPEPTTATLATPEAGLDQAESKVDSSNNLESTKATPEAEIVQAETKVDTSNNPEPANPTPETGLNQAETEPQQALAQHNEADTKPKEALAKSNPTEQQRSKAAYDSSARHGNNKTHKSSAKMNRRDVNKHRKFDPSVRRITDDPDEIRKQVEFYFGDWNFPQDKFMWESCGGPDNKPIPISTIHSFKRMRCFQPYSAVVLALRQSTFLDVDGEEGQESVKRKVAYKSTADAKAKAEASSVYVKGFGEEDPNTQFDLESFFAKFGEVRGLKLRRTNDGLFKGSVFVTFQDEEAAKQFIELQPAPTYKGNELKIMSKRAYCEDKSELIRQGKLQPNPVAPKKFFEGHDGSIKMFNGRGGGSKRGQPHGARESGDCKRQRTRDQKHGFNNRRGRGGWRGGRGGHGGSRDRDDEAKNADRRDDTNDVKPRIQSTTDQDEGTANTATTTASAKRTREDDASGHDGPPAKKVDTKDQVEAEA